MEATSDSGEVEGSAFWEDLDREVESGTDRGAFAISVITLEAVLKDLVLSGESSARPKAQDLESGGSLATANQRVAYARQHHYATARECDALDSLFRTAAEHVNFGTFAFGLGETWASLAPLAALAAEAAEIPGDTASRRGALVDAVLNLFLAIQDHIMNRDDGRE